MRTRLLALLVAGLAPRHVAARRRLRELRDGKEEPWEHFLNSSESRRLNSSKPKPEDHLVAGLPNLDAGAFTQRHWAGHVRVDAKKGGDLFYWLFEPATTPDGDAAAPKAQARSPESLSPSPVTTTAVPPDTRPIAGSALRTRTSVVLVKLTGSLKSSPLWLNESSKAPTGRGGERHRTSVGSTNDAGTSVWPKRQTSSLEK